MLTCCVHVSEWNSGNKITHRRFPAGEWYAWQDSNLRPLGPQPNALSPELQARVRGIIRVCRTGDNAVAFVRRREGRDSNPRKRLEPLQPLSRRPHSTTLAPPRGRYSVVVTTDAGPGGEGGIRTPGAFAQLFSR